MSLYANLGYDPTTDLNRTDEATILSSVPARIGGMEVVETGTVRPGGNGMYASVEILCKTETVPASRAYSTHTLVVRAEPVATPEGTWVKVEPYLIVGHYDLSLAEAVADLAQR